MNATGISNHVIAAMAKGHAFDQLEHEQALAKKDRRIAELEARVAELEAKNTEKKK
jgi:BMFP domain-containing protein YqiC